MQEKDKKQPRRTWRGFEGSDGAKYTVTVGAGNVSIVKEDDHGDGHEKTQEVEMSFEDFKHLVAMAQDLLFEAGDGVLRYPGDKDATRG